MPEQKKVWKFWFAWNTEKIERWLENEAASGWTLSHADWGLRRFCFTRGEASQVAFCLDRLSDHPQNTADQGSAYIELMKKDLWRLVNRQVSWCLWVKPYRGPKRVRFDLRHDPSVYNTVRTKRQFPILPSLGRLGMPHKS
jgi:hypothetical protein